MCQVHIAPWYFGCSRYFDEDLNSRNWLGHSLCARSRWRITILKPSGFFWSHKLILLQHQSLNVKSESVQVLGLNDHFLYFLTFFMFHGSYIRLYECLNFVLIPNSLWCNCCPISVSKLFWEQRKLSCQMTSLVPRFCRIKKYWEILWKIMSLVTGGRIRWKMSRSKHCFLPPVGFSSLLPPRSLV